MADYAENLPAVQDDTGTEIAEIETDDRDGYSRDLDTQDNGSMEAAAVAYWRSQPGRSILEEWEKFGGAMSNVKNAQALSDDFLTTLPPESRGTISSQVAALPINIQAQILAELSKGYVGKIPSASRATIEKFSDSPEAKALVMEWGSNAPRKVAVVGTRLARVFARLDAHENAVARNFLENISGSEFKAILSYLARAS